MSALTYRHIADALQGQLIGSDDIFKSASIDTRQLQGGELYIALKGERFDGHQFISEAVSKGVAALMVEQQCDVDVPQIVVADSRRGLGSLARLWRQQFSLPVIGITGSNGKTTVKEMIASILNFKGPTLATYGNLNNEIGVPLTLLRLEKKHKYAVVEMGANHVDEIRYLSQLVLQDTSLITNAGPAHLEGFGDLEGVARGKGEIYEHLNSGQTAIINADDDFAPYWRDLTPGCKRIEFGLDAAGTDVGGQWSAETNRLLIRTTEGEFDVQLHVPGIHNARNALAATAAALTVGATVEQIRLGLNSLQPVKSRLYPYFGTGGLQILDDTYNANPASLRAALEVVSSMPGEAWLVLGDMAELGQDSSMVHMEMGRLAKHFGIKRLFVMGELGALAAESFGDNALVFDAAETLSNAVLDSAASGVNVLVKGSRSMHMEDIVANLIDRDAKQQDVVGAALNERGE